MARPRKNPVEGRPKRIPFGEPRNTLSYNDRDPNFVYRVFNDVDDRIERAEAAGYEVVHSDNQVGDPAVDNPSAVGSAVSKPVGAGVTGVLMRIPKEWYEEDQAKKQKRNDEIEDQIRQHPNAEGRYGDVKITRNR